MKHTQGKIGWQLHPDNSTIFVTSNDKYNRTQTLCSLNYFPQRPDEQEANGKLIAAAPNLLDKCIKITNWLNKLADAADKRCENNRFESLVEANRADAKNYRNTAADIQRVIDLATK